MLFAGNSTISIYELQIVNYDQANRQLSGADDQQDQQQFSDVVARELIIAKQSNGPVGAVPLTFVKNLTRFENYVDLSTCE